MPAAGATALVRLMGDHGIPESLARAYLVTVRDGPLSASELAKAVGIHRVEAYRTAQGLVARGLVAATGRPREYRAIPVPDLLERFEAETHRRLHDLQQNRNDLLRAWESENIAPGLLPDARRFQLLEGRPAVSAAFVRLMGLTRREVRSVLNLGEGITAPDAVRFQAARAAQLRGVRLEAVTEVRADQVPLAQRLAALGEIRHVEGLRFPRYYLLDGTGLLGMITVDAFYAGEETRDEIAFYTTDPAIVRFHMQHFRRLWLAGVPLAEHLAELRPPAAEPWAVQRGREGDALEPTRLLLARTMDAYQIDRIELEREPIEELIGGRIGREISGAVSGRTPLEVLTSLGRYYLQQGLGKVEFARHAPTKVVVRSCRACFPGPEAISPRLCEAMLKSLLQHRLGAGYRVRAVPQARGRHYLHLLPL